MKNVFIGGAPTYVCHFFHQSFCLSIRPFAPCDLRYHILPYIYLLLDWYISISRPIGQKSANQINGSI